jgi:hypothetical protein
LNREKPPSAVVADAIPDALTLTALLRERLARLRRNIADALDRVDAVSALGAGDDDFDDTIPF